MAETDGIFQRKMTESDLEAQLSHIKSVGAVTISPELFEKLYLTPKTAEVGDFRKRFANPTPLGLMGFIIAATTFAGVMVGWGGNTQLVGVVGIFYFTGPVLLILATIFEWIMGNFLSMMVMGMFAVFWLSFGVLQTPSWHIQQAYSATGNEAEGAASVGYNAAVALYLTIWGFWLFTTWIFTLKTNLVFALIFMFASISSWLFAGAYWKVSTGDYSEAMTLQKTGGSTFFVLAILGWYMTVVMMAAEMRMFSLPVGDLSHFWPNKELANMEKDN
ncbi:GPR1/FUN34/yaaH family-domain-containing protein [Xylogone sp. PMI_703]|nr:GPR1/FUN34/yaaH family-domain-containing protein [Xylogone sp. PMI_703]